MTKDSALKPKIWFRDSSPRILPVDLAHKVQRKSNVMLFSRYTFHLPFLPSHLVLSAPLSFSCSMSYILFLSPSLIRGVYFFQMNAKRGFFFKINRDAENCWVFKKRNRDFFQVRKGWEGKWLKHFFKIFSPVFIIFSFSHPLFRMISTLSLLLYFFYHQSINWSRLAKREIPAPFVPKIRHELDLSNFSEEFTKMAAMESPGVVPNTGEKLFKVRLHLL